MRRVVITLGIVAILVSSCGRSDPTASFETRLQEQVASIRALAEEGKPGLARDRLENLVASVTSRLDQGQIDEGWALGDPRVRRGRRAAASSPPRLCGVGSAEPLTCPGGTGKGTRRRRQGRRQGQGERQGEGQERLTPLCGFSLGRHLKCRVSGASPRTSRTPVRSSAGSHRVANPAAGTASRHS